jgi:hypothetical protein
LKCACTTFSVRVECEATINRVEQNSKQIQRQPQATTYIEQLAFQKPTSLPLHPSLSPNCSIPTIAQASLHLRLYTHRRPTKLFHLSPGVDVSNRADGESNAPHSHFLQIRAKRPGFRCRRRRQIMKQTRYVQRRLQPLSG